MSGGLLKLLLASLLVRWLGLIGLAVATLAAQLLTAHWFVVWHGLERLRYDFRRYLFTILFPSLGVFAIAVGLSYVGFLCGAGRPDWITTILSSAGAGMALVGGLWFLALNADQRRRMLSSFRPLASVKSFLI